MASEDSDQIGSGFLSVHGAHHLDDGRQPLVAEVTTRVHSADTDGELLEVMTLCRTERMSLEERDDHVDQVPSATHHVSVHRLASALGPSCDHDGPDGEEVTQIVQTMHAAFSLRHDELVEYLISGSVADPVVAARLPHQTEGEASFSVNKADNPAQPHQPFLLIVRTHHIVTVPVA